MKNEKTTLLKQLAEKRAELRIKRSELLLGKTKDSSVLGKMRKEIARVLTNLRKIENA